jgi:cobalt-zinc-cadmium efflux system membrane fusion protein
LARVHSRFAGEVVEIGHPVDRPDSTTALRVGDHVRQGDLLAVVWSKDLGEKKSELVDALAQLRSTEELLARLRTLYEQGATAERSVRDAERDVQASRVQVATAERTLRTWRLTDTDLQAIRAEADHVIALDSRPAEPSDWARVEVRAPLDGVILERNVAVGEIVDPSADLFKIGDLSELTVWAHAYEEDLPMLESLDRPIHWVVSVPSRPESTFPGTLGNIGSMIDPAQHTALVSGQVENPNGELKVGQYITVTVEMRPPAGELEVPAAAVIEDGQQSCVFVQCDLAEQRFIRRSVNVTRRLRDVFYIRATSDGVRAGDRVVTSGALLLREEMDQLSDPTAGDKLAKRKRADNQS